MDLANFSSILFWCIFGPDIKWVITGKANICVAQKTNSRNQNQDVDAVSCSRLTRGLRSASYEYISRDAPGPLIYLSVYANARMEMFGYSHPVKTLTTNTFMARAVKCPTKLFIRFNVQSNKCAGWKHIFCHPNLFKAQNNWRLCLSIPRFQNISWCSHRPRAWGLAPSVSPGAGQPGSRKQPQITAGL